MTCGICQTRRPRRFCPGTGFSICAICCGTGRENTIHCPLDCEYLRDARRHEKPVDANLSNAPNQDIRVSERFLQENEAVLAALGHVVVAASLATAGAVDQDARAALDALVRTYRTLQSGFYYESVPEGPVAAALFRRVQEGIAEFRQEETRAAGISKIRDADILGLLVFLQRFALTHDNGRPLGRAFIGALLDFYPESLPAAPPADSPLILP